MTNHPLVTDAVNGAVKDAPWAAPFILYLSGVGVERWILYLGLAYGIVRLGMALVESYWKFKDRKDARKRIETK